MKRIALIVAAVSLEAGALAASGPLPMMARYTPAQLGGITGLVRYLVARPDREETRFVFLTTPEPRSLPEEVQVEDPALGNIELKNVEGADCTLAHVEVVTGRHPVVIWAARVPAARFEDNVQSDPTAMDARLFRPVTGGEAGESQVILRASDQPTRTPPLCNLADIRKAMLSIADKAN